MRVRFRNRPVLGLMATCGLSAALGGCQTYRGFEPPVGQTLPRELQKQALPPYVVEPPDVITVTALKLIPRGSEKIQPLDSLNINVSPTLPGEQPISGTYSVSAQGTVKFPGRYGTVPVAGLTPDQAAEEITRRLRNILANPIVSVSLAETRVVPDVEGVKLVTLEGKISLGGFGTIYVAGLTSDEIKAKIEQRLAEKAVDAEVVVTVSGYNSKYFYLIVDSGGAGYSISKLPVTGQETVLDILADVGGLPGQTSEFNIWIARPNVEGGCEQIIPVNVADIIKRASTCTNYQLLPGDRLYLKAQGVVTFTTALTKVIAPFEQVLGIALLGVTSYQSVITSGGSGFFGGFFPGTRFGTFGGF